MKKIISLVLTLGIMVGVFSVSASAASVTSVFSGTQTIAQGKTVSIYFTASSKPVVSTGNNSIAAVCYGYRSGSKYYYYLTMKGSVGASTGVYAGLTAKTRPLAFVAKVAGTAAPTGQKNAPATCNKSGTINVAAGDAFNFTVTSSTKPIVSTGNANVATADYLGNSGTTYNYMLAAKSGTSGGIGVYVNGTRDFVANVTASDNNGGTSAQSLDTYRTTLISLINAERAKVGVAALTSDSGLNQVADIRAQEASVNYSHSRPNGQSWDDLDALGNYYYTFDEELAIASNVNTAQEAFNSLMSEPAHRDGLLADDARIGASFYDVNGNRYCAVEMTQR